MGAERKEAPEMIPHLKEYYDAGLNVLFVGLHGVGKSMVVKQFAQKHDIRMIYKSASTLDPWTDLVGIPTPRRQCPDCGEYFPVDFRKCPDCADTKLGREGLIMVRPHEIDNAQLIMMDELNRGEPKTLNAVFELIQFRQINGDDLPHLKAVWAAINPPDSGKYNVEDLDPALVDRFDAYFIIDPQVSLTYLRSVGIKQSIAAAGITWWEDHEKERTDKDPKQLISPRRLEKILAFYELTGDVMPAIAPWITTDREKLVKLLDMAGDYEKKQKSGGKLGEGAYGGFNYDPEWLANQHNQVARYLSEHPEDIDTSKAIVQAILTRHATTLVDKYADILEAMNPTMLESFVHMMGDVKRQNFFDRLSVHKQVTHQEYPTLTRVLDGLNIPF